jgi:hypothetical protein
VDRYLAFLHFACAIIVWRATGDVCEINRTALHAADAFERQDEKPLDALRALIAESRIDADPSLPPMAAGVFGYLGYDMVRQMERHEIEAADKWIDQWFSFIVPDEDEDADLGWALERCATAVLRYGAKVVVIDPWNEMDHVRPPDMSLTEYTGFAIKQFKKFAKKYGVHLIVVAHPSKQKKNEDGTFNIPSLYDISDSQHWFNKPDVGLVVHRENEDTTIVRIAKSRYHDTIGKPGDVRFRFIRDTNRFDCVEIDVRRTAA